MVFAPMAKNGLLISDIASELSLQLCGDDGIKFGEQHFVPDATKAYFTFALSHAFPVVTVYGTGLHPNVIAKSYRSLLHQNLNYEHQLAAYADEGRDVRDRVIGSIVAVDFPRASAGSWEVTADSSKSPGITGVAVVYKQTQGMTKVVGEHVTSKRQYAVSMEVMYPFDEAGFAVATNGKEPVYNFSPPDMLKAGYEYVPVAKAPAELLATFSRKKNRVQAQWKGRKCFVLMGGLNNPVHYAGVGVVHYGAEPPAKIMRLAASADVEQRLDQAVAQMLAAFTRVNSKK